MVKFSAGILCVSTAKEKATRLLGRAKPLVYFVCVLASIAALPQVCHARVSVWLQSPKPGQNPSQVLVYATAKSPNGIAGWTIYVDDAVVYQNKSNSTTLSHNVTLSKGKHLVYARASDGTRSGISDTLMVQVGPPPTFGSVLPTPPANAKVLTRMQDTTSDWKACSHCAAGIHDTTAYSMTPFQPDPSLSGSSRELYAGGPAWTNVLFIKTMMGTSSASHFLWDFWVYHDATSAKKIWSAEFDLFQVVGGKEFMVGSQCDFGNHYWDTWDSGGRRWIVNGIPCPRWAPETWHHIQWYVERINSTQYRYDTLVVDGHGYGLGQVWKANPISWHDAIGVQWQLDQGPDGIPVHQWIDKVKLTTW